MKRYLIDCFCFVFGHRPGEAIIRPPFLDCSTSHCVRCGYHIRRYDRFDKHWLRSFEDVELASAFPRDIALAHVYRDEPMFGDQPDSPIDRFAEAVNECLIERKIGVNKTDAAWLVAKRLYDYHGYRKAL